MERRPGAGPTRGAVELMSRTKPEATPTARTMDPAAAVWLPLDALRPNPRNPRAHGAEVHRLARTIVRTTWGAPIIAQASTRRIIGGHGRLEAARLILRGLDVDGIARGGADHYFDRSAPGPGLVPVRLVDVSDAEADAMTLADNAPALQGHDDAAAIVAMATAAFERDAPTMADMGYAAADLDALVRQAGDAVLAAADAAGAEGAGDADVERHEIIGGVPERIEIEEDEAPIDRAEELCAKWGTALGQLWVIPSAHGGEHRILCGDSTRPADVARVMGGDVAAMDWSDPPYGLGGYAGRGGTLTPVEGDDADEAKLLEFYRCGHAPERYVWSEFKTYPILVRALGTPRSLIVWAKNVFGMGSGYRRQHEFLAYWGAFKGTTESDLWHEKRDHSYVHPTQKPPTLAARAMQNSTAVGDVVYCPFSGSGDALSAAEQTKRLCRAIELAPKYVAVALERLSALGLDPRLAS